MSRLQALPLASPSPYVSLNLLGSSASPEGPLDLNGKVVTLCCQTNTGFLEVLSIFKPFLLLFEVFVLSQAGGRGVGGGGPTGPRNREGTCPVLPRSQQVEYQALGYCRTSRIMGPLWRRERHRRPQRKWFLSPSLPLSTHDRSPVWGGQRHGAVPWGKVRTFLTPRKAQLGEAWPWNSPKTRRRRRGYFPWAVSPPILHT